MKTFQSFTERQLRLLVRLLKEYGALHDTETLHQIRVCIKRIKASLKMMGHATPGFDVHKAFLPFRQIFRKANAIREPELMVRLLVDYNVKHPAIRELLEPQRAHLAGFRRNIPRWLRQIAAVQEALQQRAGTVRTARFRKVLIRKRLQIRKQLYPNPDFRSIHATRKHIKQLIHLSAVNKGLHRRDYRYHKQLEQSIGQLHDKLVLLSFWRRHRTSGDTAAFQQLQTDCQRNKAEIRGLSNAYYA